MSATTLQDYADQELVVRRVTSLEGSDGTAELENKTKLDVALGIASSVSASYQGLILAIISDGVVSIVEKPQLLQKWNEVVAEYPIVRKRAIDIGIKTDDADIFAYAKAYSDLDTYLHTSPGVLSKMGENTTINPAAYQAVWNGYFSARETLLSRINSLDNVLHPHVALPVPGAISALSVRAYKDRLIISFLPPAETGNIAEKAVSYWVERSKDGGNNWERVITQTNYCEWVFNRTSDGYPTSAELGTYRVRVAAVSVYGTASQYVVSDAPDATQYGVFTPIAPSLSASVAKRTATLQIGTQTNLNNADGWDIQVSRNGTNWWKPNLFATSDASSWYDGVENDFLTIRDVFLTIGYLTIPLSAGLPAPAQNYYFRVRARCSGPVSVSDWTTSGKLTATPTLYADIAAAQIAEANLAAGSVSLTKFASSLRPVRIVDALPAKPYTGYVVGDCVTLTTDGKLYRMINLAGAGTSGWSSAVPTADLTGKIDMDLFAAGVRPPRVVAALPTFPYSTYAKGDLVSCTADGVLYRLVDASQTDNTKAWSAAVAATVITGEIVGTQIKDGAITTPKITVGTLEGDRIATGTLNANKIMANTITAGQMAAGSITSAALAVGDFTNLCTNANCELGTAGWSGVADTGSDSDGPYFIKNGQRDYWFGNTFFSVNEGEQFYVDAYFNWVSGSTAAVCLGLHLRTANDTHTWLEAAYVSDTSTGWKHLTGVVTIPAGFIKAQIWGNTAETAAPWSIWRFKKVNVRRISGTTLIADGAITTNKMVVDSIDGNRIHINTLDASKIIANTITAGQIHTGAIGVDQLAAGAVTAAKLLIKASGKHINLDPNMEDVSAWTVDSGAFVITLDTTAPCGNNVLGPSSYACQVMDANYYPIDTSKRYRVRFWAKKTSDANGTLYADLRQYSAAGSMCATNGGRSPYGISAAAITTSWVEYSYEWLPAHAQSGVRFVRLDFLLNYSGTAGKMYIQGVRFEEEIPTVLIADGAITTAKLTASCVTAANIGVTNLDVDSAANVLNLNANLIYSGATAVSSSTALGALACPSVGSYSGKYALNYFNLSTGRFRIGTENKYIYFNGTDILFQSVDIRLSTSALESYWDSTARFQHGYTVSSTTHHGLQWDRWNGSTSYGERIAIVGYLDANLSSSTGNADLLKIRMEGVDVVGFTAAAAANLRGTLAISSQGSVSALTKPLTLSANGSGTGYIGVDGDSDVVQLSNGSVQVNGTLAIVGSESNAITSVRNNGGTITTNPPTASAAIRHALAFNWYDTQWQIGNIRGENTDTQGFGITCGNANLRWRVTNGTTYDYNSLILSGGLSVGTNNSVNAAIELGSGGAATTPYLDFHSSGTGNDYDARILASGGSSAVGQGALTIYAKGGVEFTGAVQVDGTLACSHNIYVSEWVVANYGIFPGCNGVQQTSVALLGTSSGLTVDGRLAVKGVFSANGRINASCGIHPNLINTGSSLTQDNLYQMLSGFVPTIGQDYGIAASGYGSGGYLYHIQYIYRTSSTQIILLVTRMASGDLDGITCSAGNSTTVFSNGMRLWY